MGVYSQYAASVAESSVGFADESYAGVAGAYRMMEESAINSHSIFEAVIGRDYVEAYNAINPSIVSESDLEAVNEASIGEIWSKVVAFIQKIWQKLLGILKSIKDRIAAVFIRDGKELVNKYKKDILTKVTNGDFTDKFKFKWKNAGKSRVSDLGKSLEGLLIGSEAGDKLAENLDNANKSLGLHDILGNNDNYSGRTKEGRQSIADVNSSVDGDEKVKNVAPYTSDAISDITESTLGYILSGGNGNSAVSKKEFPKEFHDMWFEDEEELDNFAAKVDDVIETLIGAKKGFKNIDDAEKAVNKGFKSFRKEAEDIQKNMRKLVGKDGNSRFAAIANKQASRATTCLNIISTCSTATISAWTACFKEEVKQARAVWIKAATWRKTATTESTLLEAVEQVSDFEVEQMFDFV